jgi:uncharacterized protein YllA (UPF0747 family)
MSTQETVSFDVGPCPCGKGKLRNHVTTQDNPWSRSRSRITLDCQTCVKLWAIGNNRLTLTSSEDQLHAAVAARTAARDALGDKIDDLVTDYFQQLGALTKKAEHAEMVKLGIASYTHSMYLKRRREGVALAATVDATKNAAWLKGLANKTGCAAELNSLFAANAAADVAVAAASQKVVSFPFDATIHMKQFT